MREERLEVSVTFDERHGYVASAPKIEIAMLPDDVRVVLHSTASPNGNGTVGRRRRN